MFKNKNINVNINLGNVIKISLFLIFLYFLYAFHQLVLVIITAIVLAAAIEPLIKGFQKMKLPRVIAVILVYIKMISIVLLLFFLFVPPIMEQVDGLVKDSPVYIENLKSWANVQIAKDNALSQVFSNIKTGLEDISFADAKSGIDATAVTFKNFLIALFGGIFNFLLILVLSFYFALQGHSVRNFLKIITPVKYLKYILNLWKRAEYKITRWMQGQLIICFLLGIMTYIGLKIFFDFDQTLLLAVLAGFAGLIPVIGAIIAAIPAIAIGFFVGGFQVAIYVFILYLVIQTIESNILQPLIVKNIVGVPPFLVIISLIIGGQLFGFLGIILSIPIAAIFMEYVNDIEKKQLYNIRKGEEEENPTLFEQ